MRRGVLLCLASLVGLVLSSCNRPAGVSDVSVSTSVAGTLTAEALVAPPTSTVGRAPSTGTVTGRICYPAEGIPPMTLYLESTISGTATEVAIAQGQGTFSVDLPPDSYIVYAWRLGFEIGGAYTPAVACGLTTACTDHGLLPVAVAAGATVTGVDVCDWYGGPGSIPLPPGVIPTATTAPVASPVQPTNTGTAPGGISGSFSYPGSVPVVVVLAFNLDTPYWWWVGTASGQTWYEFDEIPPGRYQVVGYATSGLEASYGNGTAVTITPGQTTEGIDLTDWRAAGTYQAKPGEIHYP